ncbi:sulfate adenylyltransferase subunit CysN [Rhizobium sp. B230/85]|uniref:sulfate adenylyltransferase subunit CysN n=1 Tax=unclassified Rhizobium TaxID=2613769 RepID=UPI001ADB5EE6|nr:MULTISPECIES: sulfate adenylyltransferase subunit CysN [unclassified Rhizobium]MBO9136829.1 sulfate adenylyltransferase subunit CysN [Rhizobium sp. B209b/85]QXZ98997.1 sulfate adenylyltransferase subunit CysN [Rhizobium sp. B230/85]
MAVIQQDHPSSSAFDDFEHRRTKSFLRFLTCGSVDDGKSTLIGRLLYDSSHIFEDQLTTLEQDSVKHGATGSELDFALLLDGLEAEREQGITIDVAYRFFDTKKRKFIVADTPGHEEYTRNMATGASTADLAVLLVDARRGVLSQTRRHSVIASLLGIRHVILAVNKIDLVDYDERIFNEIASDYDNFAKDLDFITTVPIPISARFGDNVIHHSTKMPWYSGPTLLEQLENVPVDDIDVDNPFRFPVQYVSRTDLDFRGFAGQVASGKIAVGDPIVVANSGKLSRVKEIVSMDGSLIEAREGQAVTIVLADHLDVSRGNILAKPESPPQVGDQFQAHIIWFDREPLIPGRRYILRTECDGVTASITNLKYKIDIHNLGHIAANTLALNEFGVCTLALQSPIAFDTFRSNRMTGNFILIDRYTNATVGAGMIDFALSRAQNIHWQALEVSKSSRAALLNQKPAVLWLTGLSGSGKSTIANNLERLLHAGGRHTILLDGDNVRHGLNRDLGFTNADRVENIRRMAEVAKLMVDAGLIVIVSMISPFRSERQFARELMEPGEFVEVFIDTPLEDCIRRDPKGLYKRALAGDIRNFTGVDSPYEAPEAPDLRLLTVGTEPEILAIKIQEYLEKRK